MTDTPKFTPVFGRKTRQFDRLWQAVQYATGYDAQGMSTAQEPAFSNKWYELGRKDAIEDATPMTMVEFLKRRKAEIAAGKTFDQMLGEVSR